MRVILLEERREGLRERARAREGRPGVEEVAGRGTARSARKLALAQRGTPGKR